MPSSRPEYISDVVKVIMSENPQHLLDIGCGRGKYGVLAREYLDDWVGGKHIIEALEAHGDYITPLHEAVYDHVYVVDALNFLKDAAPRNLYLLIDVLEHFTKEDGHKLLSLCHGNVLVATPKRVMEQGAVNGNEYERHRSQWTVADLKEHGSVHTIPSEYTLLALIRKD